MNLDSYRLILDKLQGFMRKYYLRQLLQGLLIFIFGAGLLLLAVTGLEYLLWMDRSARTVFFWLAVLLGALVIVRTLVIPALRLFRIRDGITLKQGSRLIGKHFPEVGDRLLNLLELAEQPDQTELLLASIQQRSEQLRNVPFARAISMKTAWKYGRLALIPVAVVGLLLLAGKGREMYDSYDRVVNYRTAFERPAPFQFIVINQDLSVLENQAFTLKVKTSGEVQPERLNIWMEGSSFEMSDKLTHYEYTFRPPLESLEFEIEASGVRSPTYELEVVKVPLIDRFQMVLDFPGYLERPKQTIKGTGNVTVPEGTTILWEIRAVHTSQVTYRDSDTTLSSTASDGDFRFGLQAYTDKAYSISTSNEALKDFESLRYGIEVIRDEVPKIAVQMARDSLNPNLAYFAGELSDDYGLKDLRVAVWETGREQQKTYIELPVTGDLYHTFYYTFPSGLELEAGKDYSVQFEVTDNDGLRGGKRAKSNVFGLRQLDGEELRTESLKYQRSVLGGMNRAREEQEKIRQGLEEFQRMQKEGGEMNFNDLQRLEENINRQLRQEELMKKFSKELKETMEDDPEDDAFKKILEERLERQEAQARKNEELMRQMKEVLDKLDKEELQERMDELGKQQSSNERSLEQLLELTKRYYVQQQARLLGRKLQKLGEKQEVLSEINDNIEGLGKKEQQKLNTAFDSIRNGLGQLEKDNQDLKKPLGWKRDLKKENDVKNDQQEALKELDKLNLPENAAEEGRDTPESAARKQKAASRKIKELAEALEQQASSGSQSANAEDAEMLRQILDNLITFSFEEETLFSKIQNRNNNGVFIGGDIRNQQELRNMFEHVDDSLFALSLRRPEISEEVNKQIGEVYYNIDKSLESLSENQWFRGASYQQYAITASNTLAAMLAENLENMQQSMMPGQGQGGGDFQLPDIIQSQEKLKERMQGQEGSSGEQQSNSGSEGQEGGEQGSEGEESKGGKQGQQGEGAEGNRGSEGGQGQSGEQQGNSGDGKSGNEGGQDGSGDGTGEDATSKSAGDLGYEQIFEIYKEQQRIRMALEKQLEDMINNDDRELGKRIAAEMEQFENELLRNGITERTAERINQIQQRLMQLKNASFQQEQESKRESKSNTEEFANPILTRPERFERQDTNVEILNKQVLPLRLIYKQKVKTYFQNEENRLPL